MKSTLLWMLFSLAAVSSPVLYHIDFTSLPKGDARAVLKKNGFEFPVDKGGISMRLTDKGLLMRTDKEGTVLWGVRFQAPLKGAKRAKIVWGVQRFPKGADWASGKNRLALGAIFAFGKEKFSAGVPFVPKAPYFLGPFIGQKEKPGKLYVGKLYKKTGRYPCVSSAEGMQTTYVDLAKTFHDTFDKPLPALTAYGFQMNTKNTSGGAEATVKSITIYGK